MDGGTGSLAETPDPESAASDSAQPTAPVSRESVAAARAAADAATLEEDAFLGEVFVRLHEVIGERSGRRGGRRGVRGWWRRRCGCWRGSRPAWTPPT